MTAYAFFVGWGIIIMAGWAMSKYDATKRIVYYSLWLAVFLVLLTRSKEISTFVQATGLALTNPPAQPIGGAVQK
ncbi:MAG TPA: hypothetical protein VFK47_10885 [Ktedonobacteraceae bacterium]|nr:hypothetical protein [Ktedonobacteraceae bacterium]